MGKALAPFLVLFGALVLFVGQWMAFEIYANAKISRIGENVAKFLHGLHSGDTLIRLNWADENVFVFRTETGKVITTNNAIAPLKVEDFIGTSYSKGRDYAYAYIKRVSFPEYLSAFLERPFALGVSLSGFILFIFGLVLLFKKDRGADFLLREELKRKLKALRVAFAMSGLIPKESLFEAKKILDDIIKKMEGRP